MSGKGVTGNVTRQGGRTPVYTIISKINAQLLSSFLGIGGNAVYLKHPARARAEAEQATVLRADQPCNL